MDCRWHGVKGNVSRKRILPADIELSRKEKNAEGTCILSNFTNIV